MKKKISLLITSLSIVALAFIIVSFSSEDEKEKYWYTSNDVKGYISIQKEDYIKKDGNSATKLHTKVDARFEKRPISFSLSTVCEGSKMTNSNKLTFSGLMDISIKPVNFIGDVLNRDKNNVTLWNFHGDFIENMASDPEARKFIDSDFNAIIRMPDQTIPSFNLWAIVPNLPFNREGTFKFNVLDETKLFVKRKQTINYLGEVKTMIDGKNIMLHKFVHQGRRMKPTYYWVNNDKVLVQVKLDDKFIFTLTTKEKALKAS